MGVFGVAVVGSTLLLLFLTWSCIRYDNASIQKRSYRYPPSPPMNTFLGHSLPKENPFLTYASWIERYGPLISLRVGMYPFVVIGRHKAAMDILQKQGSASGDRPRMVASGELLGGGLRTLSVRAGERLKRIRRALYTHFQSKAAQTYESLQAFHAKRTVLGLLESPEQYVDHARTYSASVIHKLAYGKNGTTDAFDPDVLHACAAVMMFGRAMQPGAYLVDVFPWLKYLPWYGQELRRVFTDDYIVNHRHLDGVKRQMNEPDSGPSFAKFLLSREVDFGFNETEIAFVAGTTVSAGLDMTAIAICIAMTAAARHPNAQAAVHAELDTVVGSAQLPAFEDKESLPVLDAFILESMRWRPLTPLGIPHRATEDIIWGDYCIPAGTTVLGNHWTISRDPDVFPDPDTFDLTRWLTRDGKLGDDLKFPYFGFGRRECPGQYVATRSIFINIAYVLWSFRLSIDESKPSNDMAFLNGVARDVAPVSLRFEPRQAKETLKRMMEQ